MQPGDGSPHFRKDGAVYLIQLLDAVMRLLKQASPSLQLKPKRAGSRGDVFSRFIGCECCESWSLSNNW